MTNPSTPEGERGETPEVIYLQDEGGEGCGDYEGITWCADQIDAEDTKYIRFDIHEREAADLRKELADWKAAAEDAHRDRNTAAPELAEARRDGERRKKDRREESGFGIKRRSQRRSAIDSALQNEGKQR